MIRHRNERTLLLLAFLLAVNILSATLEVRSEPTRRFPPFNDDELWIITDKHRESKVQDLEKRSAAAQIKLDEVEKSSGKDTHEYADALFNFVELYDLSEHWEDAIVYTTRLIEATKKSGGPMSVGICYKRLAYYLFMEDKYEDAITSANTSLELLEREDGHMSPSLILDLQILGDIYTRKKQFDNAKRTYEHMLAVTEAKKDKMPLDFGKASVKLADIYRRQGKLEMAEKYYRQGIDVVKATIGTENAFVPKSMYGLSLTLLAEQKSQEAESLLTEALPLAEASLGKESGLVGAIMQHIIKQNAPPSIVVPNP